MDNHTSYLVDVGRDWLPEPDRHMAHPASFGAFACVWLPYSHHLADDANYSNLRWLCGILPVGAFLSSCVFSCLSSNRGIRPFPGNCCRLAYRMAEIDVSHASMGVMNLP